MLLLLGGVLVATAASYLGLSRLYSRVEARDRYLAIVGSVSLPVGDSRSAAAVVDRPAPQATPVSQGSGPAIPPVAAQAVTPLPTATFVARPQATASPTTPPQPLANPSPTPAAALAPPVRIRIPAIGVDRSIIGLSPVRNPKTGAYTLEVKRLFRRPGTDLVGHWLGSARPGQAGNMILVGHNYGYGYNGVFVNAGRLKAGHVVYVVNKAGDTFAYKVTAVKRLRWSSKNEQELRQHQAYLAVDGEERLTLVTCGGATWEPFPDRIYVVAEPVR